MNYIEEYLSEIRLNHIKVSKLIRLWYEIVARDLSKKKYLFDEKKANRAIKFVENFAHHHEGALAPELITLELWQKALISVLFGCVDPDGCRHFREVLVIIARKNGKTLLAAAIAELMTYTDKEYGARIYFAAPKLDQAGLCFNAFYQMITKEPELDSITKKRRTDIYIKSSNSSAQPLAFNAKKSDGLNPSFTVCDEISSWQGDAGLKQYEVLKSALGARLQPMILSISTAGYLDDGIYDELIKRATAILNGTSEETRLAPFLYIIDDPSKWDDMDELRKSNPNLGVSVKEDYLREEIAIARQSLSKKAEFLVKYCNIKQNSSQAWLNNLTIEKAFGAKLDLNDFQNCYCVGGLDLSKTTDLTCALVVVNKDGKYHVFSQFYLPQNKLEEAMARDGLPYNIYVKKGYLHLSGENEVDYRDVYNWYVSLVEKYKILPLQVGYDRYSAQYIVNDMKMYGFHMDDVHQGENLTPVIHEVEGLMKDGKINIGDNQLMKIHIANSALKLNSETERCKLVKIKQQAHIDGMAALLDAFTVYQKWYPEIGRQLENKKN